MRVRFFRSVFFRKRRREYDGYYALASIFEMSFRVLPAVRIAVARDLFSLISSKAEELQAMLNAYYKEEDICMHSWLRVAIKLKTFC